MKNLTRISLSRIVSSLFFFFFNDTAPTEIYTLSLHDALPIWPGHPRPVHPAVVSGVTGVVGPAAVVEEAELVAHPEHGEPAEGHHDRVGQQDPGDRSEEHTSELQSRRDLVCRLLLEKKKKKKK